MKSGNWQARVSRDGEEFDEWLLHKKRELKNPTYRQTETIVRLHIKPGFENKRIMKIRRTDIKNWIQSYVDKVDKNGKPKYSENNSRYLSGHYTKN
ncbi:N-terminal phage integrase SAM-like domain-containing protein [Fontibacillus panacisegetis]|uniref:N-terminal phage integrase SAM-like domain-containing protein n=1 Tax=Fontibacillus panacisegetis TaxID=670482 RepID=UPI001FE1044A|nr:N-terminal phage integrase SAM-like domain-containing protein [Fontibacillus panacisegetis]